MIVVILSGLSGSSKAEEKPSRFQLPDGFTIERAADEQALQFPMFAAFDDRGRLFVTESSGGDMYAEASQLAPTCRVSVLEDRDGDGKFEKAHVFAEQLVMPMGIAWRDGKLYVANCSEVLVLEDTDGDQRADKRKAILRGFGHSDNGSLHGLIFGPDGSLYMTVGQPDGFRFKTENGEEVWGKTGALIRCRPDGSHPELVCHGFDNLIEVAFLNTGEIIGADNWFQQPAGGVRDALVHLVEGGKYPQTPGNGSPLPRFGDDLPAITKFPAVALSGLTVISGRQFPADWFDHLLSAQFNRRCVQRHVLTRDGATFRSESIDFLTSDDPDFHPSDVLEAPDGSVLVVDTGGWYVQHCPTGKIRDSYARGGIYRIRFTGVPGIPGKDRDTGSLAALWQAPAETLRTLLKGEDPDKAALAARILDSRKEKGVGSELVPLLQSSHPHVQLAAAEALAHCGESGVIDPIWQTLANTSDRFLQHALIYAAYKVATEESLHAALSSPHVPVRRAALLLLDQPPRRALRYADLASHLSSEDALIRSTAMQILAEHPEWVTEATRVLSELTRGSGLRGSEIQLLQTLVLGFREQSAMQKEVAARLLDRKLSVENRVHITEAIASVGIGGLPPSWNAALGKNILAPEQSLRAATIHAVAKLQLADWDKTLARVAEDKKAPTPLRLDALRGIIERQPAISTPLFAILLQQLDAANDSFVRLGAAQLLSRAKLSAKQEQEVRRLVGNDLLIAPLIFPQDLTSTEEQRATLARHEGTLTGGESKRGRQIFFGKAICVSCHRVGSEGGTLGPDLTRIGTIRSRRDLLESIVIPSATFAQGYEPVFLTTKTGATLSGMIARQTADWLLIRNSAGTEQRIGRDQVQHMQRSPLSLMPTGLDQVITSDELRDLLAYLESLR